MTVFKMIFIFLGLALVFSGCWGQLKPKNINKYTHIQESVTTLSYS